MLAVIVAVPVAMTAVLAPVMVWADKRRRFGR